jgi:hypothetical protein
VGFTIVNAFGLPGDSLDAQAVHSEGAIGYNTTAWGPYAIYGSGNKMGYLVDGIFNTDTPVFFTHNWSAVAYDEHVWGPQWRTSIYGGLLGTDFGSEAKAQICAVPNMPGGFSSGMNAVFQNNNGPGFGTSQSNPPSVINNFKGNVSNRDPNSGWTQLGTGTMWNPVPDIDIGVDLSWAHLNTAFAGTAGLNAWGSPNKTPRAGRQAFTRSTT